MRRLSVLLLPLGILLGLTSTIAACDSDYYYGSTGGFAGRAPIFDAGSIAVEPGPCASASEGRSCVTGSGTTSSDGIPDGLCEAKTVANARCNPRLRCDRTSYSWRNVESERSPCASDCPTSYTETPPSGTCTAPRAGTMICEYPEGTCGCAPIVPRGPDAGVKDGGVKDAEAGAPVFDASADADAGGLDGGTTAYAWRCVKPEPSCPRTRPAEGESCVKPMTCDYGDCVFEDGVRMRCQGKQWAVESECGQ